MRTISTALLTDLSLPPGMILEVGCGGGAFLAELGHRYPAYHRLALDLNLAALRTVQQRYRHTIPVARADLHQLPINDNTCAMLVALDAFDQVAVQLGQALHEAARVLAPGGILLLRVSAYDWLLGPHDRAFGTGRRYGTTELKEALAPTGLELHRLSHANTFLLLPAILARMAQRQGAITVEEPLVTSGTLNTLLTTFLRAEALWLRHRNLPAGLSLYALARKVGPRGTGG